MWKTDTHACEVIRTLLHTAHLDPLWSADGPTQEALEHLAAGGGPLSHGEAIMLRVAFDLWNGTGKATLDDLLSVLDQRNLSAVLTAIREARPDAP